MTYTRKIIATVVLIAVFIVFDIPSSVYAARSTYTINDDANQNKTGDATVLTDATKIFGTNSTNSSFSGYRIVSVAIPNSATIRHAYLKVYMSSVSTNSGASATVSGESADNSAAFTTAVNDISARALTTANSVTEIEDLADGYVTIDVTSIVQEIVNRAGWTSGNALTFILGSPNYSSTATLSNTESSNDPSFGVIYDGSATTLLVPSVSGSGSFTNPNNAFANDAAYATMPNSTNGAQVYESFNVPDLTGATIDGILIKTSNFVSSGTQRAQATTSVSWDGGTTWSANGTSSQALRAASVGTSTFGGADQWNHNFVASELTNANFKVRFSNYFDAATEDMSLDWLTVQVFYTGSSATTYGAEYIIVSEEQ